MATPPRYLWGVTKVQYIDFAPSSDPAAKAGRMYFDIDTNNFKFCEDSTHFMLIRDVLHN